MCVLFQLAPTCCDHYYADFANRTTICRVTCVVRVFLENKRKKGRKRAGERESQKGREGGMASHILLPKDVMIQKQKLINQPVPKLSLSFVLYLISSFPLSSLHLSLLLCLLQYSWEEAEAAVTQLHQDSLSPSAAVALLCARSSPTYIFLLPPSFSVFWASVRITTTPSTIQRMKSSRRMTMKQLWQSL